MERRLGRGLGALLGGSASTPAAPAAAKADQVVGPQAPQELPVTEILPNSQQPRVRFDVAALEGLRDSIKQHGVIQAIAVRKSSAGYELISGERRLKAAKMAGLEKIPVIVHTEVNDQQSLEWAMVENLQREDLDPVERAKGFELMIERLNLSQEQVADRVGLKRSTVTNHLRLLELPDEVQEALIQGLLTMGHARALAGLTKASQQVDLLGKAVRSGLSVRQVEQAVKAHNAGPATSQGVKAPGKTASGAGARREPWVSDVEARLREALGTQVVVEHRKDGKGQISVTYFDAPELERLLNQLAPRRPI
jgi:ParB family transcriptional regulator, chromosome partitioning protein